MDFRTEFNNKKRDKAISLRVSTNDLTLINEVIGLEKQHNAYRYSDISRIDIIITALEFYKLHLDK